MTVVRSIRVVQQAPVRGVLYSRLNKAYKLAFMAVFSTRVVIIYLSTLAPVSVVNKFQLLWAFFYQLKQALICFSFKSSN